MIEDIAVIIPARIGSTRLPRKLVKHIGDKSVIEHVMDQVKGAGVKHLYVATDSTEIASVVQNAGNIAIMTDADCPTGSDRVQQAVQKISATHDFNYIINVQGDMPFVDASIIQNIAAKLAEDDFDIVTPFVKISKEEALLAENVKIVKDNNDKALYFSRCPIPYGGDEFLYHVGIYGFKAESLSRFVGLAKGKYEQCESLEQLRALENGMSIGLVESNQVPISIDTQEDFDKAVEYFNHLN